MRLTVYFPEDSPTTHDFVGTKLTVGRLGDNDVQLDEASVSSRHAEIVIRDGTAVLCDLQSTNGTFLNGEQVTGEAELKQNDEIYFGNVRSVFVKSVTGTVAEIAAAEPVLEEASVVGGRPENFRYMSPLPKKQVPKDWWDLAGWVSLGLGLLVGAYALFVILGS